MAEQDIDSVCNRSGNEHFDQVIEVDEQRRNVLKGCSALAVASFLGMPALNWTSRAEASSSPVMGFEGVPVSSEDVIRVPPKKLSRNK